MKSKLTADESTQINNPDIGKMRPELKNKPIQVLCEILGLPEDISLKALKKAGGKYKQLLHPDTTRLSPESTEGKEVEDAFIILDHMLDAIEIAFPQET
jgi:hypothetical protein